MNQKNQSNQSAKSSNTNQPTQAIVTPKSKKQHSNVTEPGVENVIRAKNFVDENKK